MTSSHRLRSLAALSAAALLAAGCAGLGGGKARAIAPLTPTAAVPGTAVNGTVHLRALDHGVRLEGEIRGLKPGQEHGFHIHEKGDCSNNANASGGHFNPGGGTHGMFGTPGSHAGELPSLIADAQGHARFSVDVHSISLTDGAANNVVGRALVVHRDRDDHTTQPAGNSGPRVSCAVIARN